MAIDQTTSPRRPRVTTWVAVIAVALSLAVGHAYVWLLLSVYALAGGLWGAAVIARLHRRQDAVEFGREAVRARWRTVWIASAAASSLTLMMILLVPPYQSPDAGTHMLRAYSLLDNRVTLRPATKAHWVNALADHGLVNYGLQWTDRLAFRPDTRVDEAFATKAAALRWSGKNDALFCAAAIYFPALYSPGAAALGIARGVDAPLGASVLAARLAMGFAAMTAVLLALASTRAGFFTMCIVAMLPMSLCQFAGANLDTMAISTGLLVAALTTCGAYGRVPGRVIALPPAALLGAWLLMAMLVVTKPVFLVYLLYPAWCAVRGQWRTTLLPVLLCLALGVGWQLHVGRNYFEPRMVIEGTPLANLVDALMSPIDTISAVVRSLESGYDVYWKSTIGILGWLDTPMSSSAYAIASTALVAAACADAASRNPLGGAFRRLMCLAAAAYFVGIFLFLLVAWTPGGSERIVGVQGRYFLQMLPLAAMALGLAREARTRQYIQPAFAIGVVVYALWAMWYLRGLVLHRYWQ